MMNSESKDRKADLEAWAGAVHAEFERLLPLLAPDMLAPRWWRRRPADPLDVAKYLWSFAQEIHRERMRLLSAGADHFLAGDRDLREQAFNKDDVPPIL